MAAKKGGRIDMNWQAKQAKERLQDQRPELAVRAMHPRLQAKKVVEYLQEHRNGTGTEPRPRPNRDFLSVAQVRERTHVDIAGNERVREGLDPKTNPKIEWSKERDRLRYKARPPPRRLRAAAPRIGWARLTRAPRPLGQPEFDAIENQNQLRELVMRCEFGIARDRLEDSYASTKVKEDIEVRRRLPAPPPSSLG